MPVIHSSPHPNKDLSLHEDFAADNMAGNPYPNVEPGYDADQWQSRRSAAGRGFHPGSRQGTMQYDAMDDQEAPPLAFGRPDIQRGRSPSRGHPHHSHTFQRQENMNSYPVEGRHRGVSFSGRSPGRPSFRRPHYEDEEDEEEEEEEEDEGEWSDEGEFEHDPYEEEGQVFLPPKMGRGRAWDSSDEEEFDRESIYEDEDEFDEEEEEFEGVRMRHFRGGMMHRGGPPHRRQARMGRSSPPPLMSPPDSPPRLSRGMPPMRGMMRGRGMDPRMTRGRGMDPRMMRGRGVSPPRMMNSGGMRRIPVQGGPPFARGMPRRQQAGFTKRARFADSASSSSGSRGPGFQRLPGGFRPPSRTGGSIKKAIQWLTKPINTPALHPILRPGTLIRPVEFSWDVNYPPSAVRAGLPPGVGVAGFSEPATSPPVQYMRLIVPIPGLDAAEWTVDVWPFGSPFATSNQLPPSPYSFVGLPSPFARALPMSPFAGMGPHVPIVRCADVFHALHRMLGRRAVADDFWALDTRRRERVSQAFWVRCRAVGAEFAARAQREQGLPPTAAQEEMERQIQSGVKRIDFMEGRTRWEGLEWRDTDEWVVKLGRT